MSVLQRIEAPNVRVSNYHPTNEDIRELHTWPADVLSGMGCYKYMSGDDWHVMLLPQSWLLAVPEDHILFLIGEDAGERPFTREKAKEYDPILGMSPWAAIVGDREKALAALADSDLYFEAGVKMIRAGWRSFVRAAMDHQGVEETALVILKLVNGVISTGDKMDNAELAMLVLDLFRQKSRFPEFTDGYIEEHREDHPKRAQILEATSEVLRDYSHSVADSVRDEENG